jgi:hypothetical protein
VDSAAGTVVKAFEGALLERVITRTRALDPAPALDDETTRQFVHGFVTIVREAATGGRDARDLYTAAAADVAKDQGRTPASVAQSLVRFGVVVGDELGRELAPSDAAAAADWLAVFLAEWASELVTAMGDES